MAWIRILALNQGGAEDVIGEGGRDFGGGGGERMPFRDRARVWAEAEVHDLSREELALIRSRRELIPAAGAAVELAVDLTRTIVGPDPWAERAARRKTLADVVRNRDAARLDVARLSEERDKGRRGIVSESTLLPPAFGNAGERAERLLDQGADPVRARARALRRDLAPRAVEGRGAGGGDSGRRPHTRAPAPGIGCGSGAGAGANVDVDARIVDGAASRAAAIDIEIAVKSDNDNDND